MCVYFCQWGPQIRLVPYDRLMTSRVRVDKVVCRYLACVHLLETVWLIVIVAL